MSNPIPTAPAPFLDLALIRDLAERATKAESQPVLLKSLAPDQPDLDPDKLLFFHQGKLVDASQALLQNENFSQVHTTVDSFCSALKRWGRSGLTVVAMHPTDDRVEAALDYYAERSQTKDGKDTTCTRRRDPQEFVTLKLLPSEEYAAWAALNGKEIEQQAFAEFIELHIEDVAGDGQTYASGNQFLKIAMELEARKDVQWAAKVNPQTGDRSMSWKESTGAEGATVVPKRVLLRLRPYQGAPQMDYLAALAFRAQPSGVKFKLTFIGLDRAREAARALVAETIEEKAGFPVFDGTL